MLIVMLMVMLVNILLLYAAAQLSGTGVLLPRVLLGAVLGALLTTLTLVPGTSFGAHILWRLGILLVSGWVSFGVRLFPICLFGLLQLSLGGVSAENMAGTLLGAAGMGFACLILGQRQRYLPVELTHRAQTVHLKALRDTGNTLRDPISGRPVLIVGADIARSLTGLTPEDLRDPIKTVTTYPGLRLIPYQTVGNHGFLLALQIHQAKIGAKWGSVLVAFSPNLFGSKYQALTGGMV